MLTQGKSCNRNLELRLNCVARAIYYPIWQEAFQGNVQMPLGTLKSSSLDCCPNIHGKNLVWNAATLSLLSAAAYLYISLKTRQIASLVSIRLLMELQQ